MISLIMFVVFIKNSAMSPQCIQIASKWWLLALLVALFVVRQSESKSGVWLLTDTKLNDTCSRDSECGHGTSCQITNFVEKKCRCKMNFFPNMNKIDCYMKNCINDLDCFYDHTECKNNYCFCRIGWEFDLISSKCTKHECWANFMCPDDAICHNRLCIKIDTSNFSYSFLAQNIFTIIIISNFILWLSIFVYILRYAKKRRQAAATAAAQNRHLRGGMSLMPGLPPPPPSYDNIGMDPICYPPPPPYSPTMDNTDPNKTTTTVNAQSDGAQTMVAILNVSNSSQVVAHNNQSLVTSANS